MGDRIRSRAGSVYVSMKLLSIQILLLAFVASSWASQSWYNLRTPFNINPLSGFYQMPRTEADAIGLGWIKVSDGCGGGATFPGVRYKETADMFENTKFLIYDANGFIAGMQAFVPKDQADGQNAFSFADSKWYVQDEVDGTEIYVSTVWTVEEDVICTGRTQDQFDEQGTGYVVHMQNGPTAADFDAAPLKVADGEGTDWKLHKCFINMGDHMFTLNYDPNEDCAGIAPFQLLYDHQGDKPLAGFVFQHLLGAPGGGWDKPAINEGAINAIIDTPPTCLLDSIADPGLVTMHVYLLDYAETCLF